MGRLIYWIPVKDGDPRARALYRRHYSSQMADHKAVRNRLNPRLFMGPGEKMVLLTLRCDALFLWRRFIDDSGQQGVNCAAFRNESDILSSTLIVEAMEWAWGRWPGERLYTYVNAARIQSSNPGYCFLMAGWLKYGKTKAGLDILEYWTGQNGAGCLLLDKTRGGR